MNNRRVILGPEHSWYDISWPVKRVPVELAFVWNTLSEEDHKYLVATPEFGAIEVVRRVASDLILGNAPAFIERWASRPTRSSTWGSREWLMKVVEDPSRIREHN